MAHVEKQEETAELLVELYSEEIPWRLQEPMVRNLEKFLQEELEKGLGLKKGEGDFGEIRVYSTPRRVAVGIVGVLIKSRAWEEERNGPRVNSPQVAIEGFLRANGLSSLEECRRVADEKKGDYWAFVVKHAAVATREILGEVVVRVIERIAKALPVSMRFGEQSFRWVRPLRHILVVFNGDGVEGALELGNEEKLRFTNETRGHPFAAPEALTVKGIKDYEKQLREHYVEPSYEERLDKVFRDVTGRKMYNYQKKFPGYYLLLQENTRLTECPIVLKGHFDEEFKELPDFLINTVLNEHQKIIRDIYVESGECGFFMIANTPNLTQEQESEIIKGFERVVQARLADAKFMLERDIEKPIDKHIENLQHIIFHPRLGTIADKNERASKLIPIIFKELKTYNKKFDIEEYDSAWWEKRVNSLKLDLATETVKEFPSLHKSIGNYLLDINDPTLKILIDAYTIIIDIADNIDSLVSLWSVEAKPTGSGDPFALRRYALDVISCLARKDVLEEMALLVEEKALLLEETSLPPEEISILLGKTPPPLEEMSLLAEETSPPPEEISIPLDEMFRPLEEISLSLKGISLPLRNIFEYALDILFVKDTDKNFFAEKPKSLILDELIEFMLERLRIFIKDREQLPHDYIEAVLAHEAAKKCKKCNIYLLYNHAKALSQERDYNNLLNNSLNNPLAEIFTRLHAIMRSSPYDIKTLSSSPDPTLFKTTEEKNLHARIQHARIQPNNTWQKLDFQEKLQVLGKLKDAIDPFFNDVLVMHREKNIRLNRLRLLDSIYRRFLELADFTKIHHKDKQKKQSQKQ